MTAPPRRPRIRAADLPPLRERLLAYSDEERDRARARLRIAQDSYRLASSACPTCGGYGAATKERDAAAAHALAVGIKATEIAGVYGLRSHTNVSRMVSRHHGEDHNSEMKRRRRAR
jgi:hypothetical protein